MTQSYVLTNKTKSVLLGVAVVGLVFFANLAAYAQTEDQTNKVTATGMLQESDNAERGNLILESDKGKIYIQTVRDFSLLLGKEVVLDAEGTLESFIFIGLTEVGDEPEDQENDMGGPTDEEQNGDEQDEEQNDGQEGTFSISGRFENSDDTERGNYVIETETGKVYLKSVRDYSALVGQEVVMKAQGSLQDFNQAVVTQK